jgi:hypothetical protein
MRRGTVQVKKSAADDLRVCSEKSPKRKKEKCMKHVTVTGISTLTTVLSISLICGGAMAGQFKTLNTAGLSVNQQISACSSPKNTPSGAIEMEVYEWETSAGGGTYQCRIIRNTTSQPLNISLVGLNATIIGSCNAPDGGGCSTPPVSLVGGAKFQCLVATQCCGNPVSSEANYTMAVQVLGMFDPAARVDTKPSPAGVIDR